jgi:hypothetical protein
VSGKTCERIVLAIERSAGLAKAADAAKALAQASGWEMGAELLARFFAEALDRCVRVLLMIKALRLRRHYDGKTTYLLNLCKFSRAPFVLLTNVMR